MPPSRPPERLSVRDLEVRFGDFAAVSMPAFAAEPGALWGVAGPSGSGKTTFLFALAGLLRPSAGAIVWGETPISAFAEAARDRWRRETVGMVFQDFQLLPELDALENVLLPIRFARWGPTASERDRARGLLDRVGIARVAIRAGLLSRGEQQRVALARALMGRPRLILADEPTASLDRASGAGIVDLLVETARESGATAIAVSHDAALLTRMDRVLTLDAGRSRS